MSTYRNCYSILATIRQALGDYSDAKVRGEDTFGGYHNDYLTEKINDAVRGLYSMIVKRVPGLFLGEANLTGVNSVFTLPWDFAKLERFSDDLGRTVYEIGETKRRLVNSEGSDRLYRRVGNTLVLDQAGVTKTYRLVYRKKPRDIHSGLSQAGGLASITLGSDAKKIADYYNGMIIENVTQDWVDTIDDYTAARVATISETAAKSDAYGIVPEIPEWSHHLIAPKASLAIRAEHPLSKSKPTRGEYADHIEQVRVALVENAGPSGDVDIMDVFHEFEPYAGGAQY